MRLHDEDRELQIRLAELQADVQINLTICFGLLTILFAVIIGLQQVYFTLPAEYILIKHSILPSMVTCIILVAFVMNYYFRKAVDARNQMKELRKQDDC